MTERLYYKDPYLKETKARVLEVKKDGELVKIRLDRTIFYPEGGGQPGDRGVIEGDEFKVIVENTIEENGEIWHVGKLEGDIPKEGSSVKLKLDWEWRYGNMQIHTGQHILSAVLKKLYDLDTTGFTIFGEYAKIEVNGELSWDMIERAEIEANKVVWSNVPVKVEEYEELPPEVARELRKSVVKSKGKIRIVRVGDVDATPCGGTHVSRTGEVGVIKVLRFYKKSRDLWRIEFTCGYRAITKLDKLLKDYWLALDMMPNKNPPLLERVKDILSSLESREKKIEELRREIWKWKGESLLRRGIRIGGYNVVYHIEDWNMKDAQAFAVDFVKNNPGTILILVGSEYVIFAKNENVKLSMRELLKNVMGELGGKGGGTENLARGKIEASPNDIINVTLEKLKEMLKS
ncbi:alanyl-tRNA synthetase [Pyrococcus sp. NA2]|uniref:alanyl-tRNA editing protein n=1 Tax=Pyrococcus sp. (strain NA2) TaxID=342949 RepID=UPI000209AF73|nr:alanine--tRNA ligase-related protein [Pyrococcus sp. NA2]AEC51757.1 alanyl-tRNA synthetase [Pyrococcus sp. NA2]